MEEKLFGYHMSMFTTFLQNQTTGLQAYIPIDHGCFGGNLLSNAMVHVRKQHPA